jgi:hypothetical protein
MLGRRRRRHHVAEEGAPGLQVRGPPGDGPAFKNVAKPMKTDQAAVFNRIERYDGSCMSVNQTLYSF